MGPQVFGRYQLRRPAEHGLPLVWVYAVRDPEALGMPHHLEIYARTTRGAALDLQARMVSTQPVHHPGHRTHLFLGNSPAATQLGPGVESVTVAVPFDVGDRILPQKCINP